jgi:hypothetical protein
MFFIPGWFNTWHPAPNAVIPAKGGIQKKANWMPDQARHDEKPQHPAACGGMFY